MTDISATISANTTRTTNNTKSSAQLSPTRVSPRQVSILSVFLLSRFYFIYFVLLHLPGGSIYNEGNFVKK